MTKHSEDGWSMPMLIIEISKTNEKKGSMCRSYDLSMLILLLSLIGIEIIYL